MMHCYKYISLVILCVFTGSVFSQGEDKVSFNDGIALYEKGDYAKAQQRFEQAYAKNPKYARALYNAGNAAYLRGDFDKAKSLYGEYAKQAQGNEELAKAHYNLGNVHLQKADALAQVPEKSSDAQTLYKQAIQSFKESLKHNPNDPDAKYNLTYALSKLQQQQQQNQDQKNQDQNKKNDQKQDQQKQDDKNNDSQDKNGEGDNNSDDQKDDKQDDSGENQEDKKDPKENEGNGNQGEQKEEPAKPIEGQISKAQAEKDLDAINADEGKILQKVYRKKGDEKSTTNSGKDW